MLQQVHDAGIGGTIIWVWHDAFIAELGRPDGFTAYGRGESAEEIAAWVAEQLPTMVEDVSLLEDPLSLIQWLHDREINGKIEWWKPEEGFIVTIDEEPVRLATWKAVEKWVGERWPETQRTAPAK